MEKSNDSNTPFDLVLVGHFAFDTIVLQNPYSKSQSLGGGVTYGSLAARFYQSDALIGIISKIKANESLNCLKPISKNKINIDGVRQEGSYNTEYLLKYHDHGRDLQLISKANEIDIHDFPPSYFNTRAIHLTPIADEFTPEFLNDLSKHQEIQDAIIGVDVQGFIRGFDECGNITIKNGTADHQQIFDMLSKFGSRMFFKASDLEAQGVTHEKDLKKATELLGLTGAYILTTLGDKGLYFKAPNHPLIHINAYRPIQCVDETGAGDCFMAVLLLQIGQIAPNERSFENIVEAIQIASSASSFLIEKKGPNGFQTKWKILSRIKAENEILFKEDNLKS
ncbi:Ribokinase [Candidatus Lokiarchaeum ossiferum]|uniref:Ribokinase n=1 Tax=Candidatus Lokiarchaeum ossiferum TaxID=2951803 RepID=A0ABY6HWH3_9ARCH|nr:Ribokinase [Candidatus Lokiarchaeum sp. B-35]